MINRMKVVFLAVAALLLSQPAMTQTGPGTQQATDVVVEWNAITLAAVSGQNGVEQVRLAAIAHLAVFEAVNAIVGDFEPYLGTVVAPAGASAEAAAVAAAHGVLKHYLPDQAASLDAARESSLAAIPDGAGKDGGIAVGEAAAVALFLHRANDGSEATENYLPQSGDPGQWQLTPSCQPEGGLFFHWRKLTPFGIRSADQFRSDPPPALTSRRFARDFNEVKSVGGVDSEQRPADRADVANFYAAVPSQAAWNPIARQVASARRASLSDNARLFALLNMAMNDALVAVMDTKYHYTRWRPETAIRAGDTDGNSDTEPDAGFKPFVATPCHPSYPSAHASASYAAREVIQSLFGDEEHVMKLSTPALPDVELHYTRLEQITRDIDDARIYGGIHFRSDQEAGARQGGRIGQYVVAHNLKSRHDDRHDQR
jgi:hypothetical protein